MIFCLDNWVHFILRQKNGGEGGIRTHGTSRFRRSPSARLRPLGHFSAQRRILYHSLPGLPDPKTKFFETRKNPLPLRLFCDQDFFQCGALHGFYKILRKILKSKILVTVNLSVVNNKNSCGCWQGPKECV